MESGLDHGTALAEPWGFAPVFRDEVALAAGFEGLDDGDTLLPLALLAGPGGLRLEVVRHRRTSGRPSAYGALFRGLPPDGAGAVEPASGEGESVVRDVLRRAGPMADPVYRRLPTVGGLAWYDAVSTEGGLAGILCTVPDVIQEAAFWAEFAGASWQERGPDAACGTIPSPRPRGECAFVIARGEDGPGHAMNDVGFPSMGVFSTSIEADRDRAVAAGATPLAEPIVTDVGGRRLAMALIRTPGGAPVELLSVARKRTRRMG
ncbi:VOC family protein [Streptomyces sp. NPDC093795]|uniref:VOC family protein n=1 Tax=Streptomyces sp. NPDC093795 TaxID=3366051 RepID=UPI00380439A2